MVDDKLVEKRGIFNEDGDIALAKRCIIQGNTTNLNDFNNLRYSYTMDWYRASMNNFWIPEEINVNGDRIDYESLSDDEKLNFKRILSDINYLDSLQSANLPNLQVYVTANEINLCLSIVTYQESIHSKAYAYILNTLTGFDNAEEALYMWKDDEKVRAKGEFVERFYEDFLNNNTEYNFVKSLIANYLVEGLFFATGYSFIYNFASRGLMAGTVAELRNIQRDENMHLELFRNVINDLKNERADLFGSEYLESYKEIIKEAVELELGWASFINPDNLENLSAYIKYLANTLAMGIGFETLYPGYTEIPATMRYIEETATTQQANPELLGEKVAPQTNTTFIEDDL